MELQAAVANQVQLEGLINHPPWNLKLVQVKHFKSVISMMLSGCC